MSPWEVIGWTIAIPMLLVTLLFVFALIGAIFKTLSKPRKSVSEHPARRHLRIVEDD
jgi:hypothetical protein